MSRRDWQYLVVAAMIATGLYVSVSGLVTDLYGLYQFVLHRYAGYACAVLVLMHLLLNRRRVWTYAASRLGRRERCERAAPPAREAVPLLDRRSLLVTAVAGAGGFLLGRLLPAGRGWEQGDWGQQYHEWSKPGRSGLGAAYDWGTRPQLVKAYRDAPAVLLPAPHGFRGLALEEAIEKRRSRRVYEPGSLSLEELARLLHAASGVTEPRTGFRAAPSAGALYPIETYAIVHEVEGLEPGLYHYAVFEHALERLQTGNMRAGAVVAGIGQEMLGTAQVCVVLSAIFQRTRWRYRERAYRYVLLEAGHMGQNLYLAATSMGLGACAVGAFLDDRFNDLLGVDGSDEAVVYVVAVGRTAALE